MSFNLDTLYGLLPAVYRIRDAREGEPLRALLAVIAEQVTVLEEDLAQLYDDQFIETCAPWAVPYIGDLLGVRGLYELGDAAIAPNVRKALRQRAQVANTIAYRRRKGTAALLEQLAYDTTGWRARVVEFFQLLATTQHMNHLRGDHPVTVNLRDTGKLHALNTPFDCLAHSAEVRNIASRRGKYNIPNVGIFLWRLQPYSLTDSPAFPVDKVAGRYTFSPLGNPVQLFTRPETETRSEHLADPINVPMPILRYLVCGNKLENYYGQDKSFSVLVKGQEIARSQIRVCDLSDDAKGDWRHTPGSGTVAVDTEQGRIAFADAPDGDVRVTFHYGFSSDMGGGEYERSDTFDERLAVVKSVTMPDRIQDALAVVASGGAVEVRDSGVYQEELAIDAHVGARIELRAANGVRPALILTKEMTIRGAKDAEVTLSGLLIAGATVRAGGELRLLRLVHCTLVPGLKLSAKGDPEQAVTPSLIVESPNTLVEIDRCIVGGFHVADGAGLLLAHDARVRITNSIVDATDATGVAYAGLDGVGPGAPLRVENSTFIGRVHTALLPLACNSIFLAAADSCGPWQAAIRVDRQQEGCVRFCYVPWQVQVPRRYHCQPDRAAAVAVAAALKVNSSLPAAEQDAIVQEVRSRVVPQFNSVSYGQHDYCQLGQASPVEIRQGADDGAEMGAFHNLYQPQREANLLVRLPEYLRFGLEAGVFYVT